MKDFQNIITTISSLTAVLSVLATLFAIYFNKKSQTKSLNDIREKSLDELIDSFDIKLLGKYLDNNLGQVTIKEYSANKKIQKIVNKYVQTIVNYIGTEEKLNQKVSVPENGKEFSANISADLIPIILEYETGQTWNALAKLRRHIEITIRDLANENKLQINEYSSPQKILSTMYTLNILSKSTVDNLNYVIKICSKAIHGIELSQEEEDNALNLAIKSLDEIEKLKK